MNVIACVPIKLNNERLKNKNLKEFYDGTPLIHLILKTLIKSKFIDDVYVFCSDEQIIKHLPKGVKFLKREEILDLDAATPQDIINSFTSKIDASIYVFSHATSPFISLKSINLCITKVLERKHDSAFTVEKIQKLLWKENRAFNFNKKNIPRTQDLDIIYAEVSAAYVFTREVFTRFNSRIGQTPYLCEVSKIEAIDIDYPIDFEIANSIYKYLLKKGDND